MFFIPSMIWGMTFRFDCSSLYDMAVSWQRLIEGTGIQEEDYILLQHEYLELTLMEGEGLKYDEAHIKASEQFDYATIIKRREAEE
jgi:hypothetical protein